MTFKTKKQYIVEKVNGLLETMDEVYKDDVDNIFPPDLIRVHAILDEIEQMDTATTKMLKELNYLFKKTTAKEKANGMDYFEFIAWQVEYLLTKESMKDAIKFLLDQIDEKLNMYTPKEAKKFIEKLIKEKNLGEMPNEIK